MDAMKVWAEGLKGIQSLKWCGCGNPDEGYEALLETLRAHSVCGPNEDGTPSERQKWAEARGGNWHGPGNGYDYLILYFLDANGLMEHGGNVGGGWLTAKGEAVKLFLEEWGTDSDEWPNLDEFG